MCYRVTEATKHLPDMTAIGFIWRSGPDFESRIGWVGLYRKQVYPRLPRGVPGRNVAYSMSLPWSERYIEAVSFVLYQRDFKVLSDDFAEPFQRERILTIRFGSIWAALLHEIL